MSECSNRRAITTRRIVGSTDSGIIQKPFSEKHQNKRMIQVVTKTYSPWCPFYPPNHFLILFLSKLFCPLESRYPDQLLHTPPHQDGSWQDKGCDLCSTQDSNPQRWTILRCLRHMGELMKTCQRSSGVCRILVQLIGRLTTQLRLDTWKTKTAVISAGSDEYRC